jgi:hypothetical protein
VLLDPYNKYTIISATDKKSYFSKKTTEKYVSIFDKPINRISKFS